ncbi:hypothetical protein ABTZ21_34120 [Streptomyces sp. NPDC096191]|uniref:hypothetical protein n=1 Tax=Streptomyces sp. NPDC096191 TaxID=3155426 RepID=UPI00332A2A66
MAGLEFLHARLEVSDPPDVVGVACPVRGGPVFTAAAPRDEDWLKRKAWAPYIGGTLENHDIDCLRQDLTLPERMDEIAEVLRARLR